MKLEKLVSLFSEGLQRGFLLTAFVCLFCLIFFPRRLWIIAFYSYKNNSSKSHVFWNQSFTIQSDDCARIIPEITLWIWLFIVPDKITFLTTKSGFRLVQLIAFKGTWIWLVNSRFFTQKLHRCYSIRSYSISLSNVGDNVRKQLIL